MKQLPKGLWVDDQNKWTIVFDQGVLSYESVGWLEERKEFIWHKIMLLRKNVQFII